MKELRKKGTAMLDAGHGGTATGADGKLSGIGNEEDINLRVTMIAASMLRAEGWEVIETRTADVDLSVNDRLKWIRKQSPDVFVSVHCNAVSDPKVNGVETIFRDEYDRELAKRIHAHICAFTGLRNRGLLQDGTEMYNRGLAVLKDLETPACLVELGFLSNKSDAEYISRNVSLYAEAIAKGIESWRTS